MAIGTIFAQLKTRQRIQQRFSSLSNGMDARCVGKCGVCHFITPLFSNLIFFLTEKIIFSVDDVETGTIKAGSGFWSRGSFNLTAPNTSNPWRLASNMAPFDQEFFIALHLAAGGNKVFPDDDIIVASGKPWLNSSPTAVTEFWNARNGWLPTWNLEQNLSRDASLLVDYVRIWAL